MARLTKTIKGIRAKNGLSLPNIFLMIIFLYIQSLEASMTAAASSLTSITPILWDLKPMKKELIMTVDHS